MNDGGPAFPAVCGDERGQKTDFVYHGMSLRDYFAAAALQGMMSCQDFINEVCRACGSKESARSVIAQWAYHQADDMLARREATSK